MQGIPTPIPMSDEHKIEKLQDIMTMSAKALSEVATAIHDAGLNGQASLIDTIVANMTRTIVDTTDRTTPIEIAM